jgi:hypothetical protein
MFDYKADKAVKAVNKNISNKNPIYFKKAENESSFLSAYEKKRKINVLFDFFAKIGTDYIF